MTFQFKILTGMLASGMNINPFKGATEEDVKEDFDYAKKIYKGVFGNFLSAWCLQKAFKQKIISSLHPIGKERERMLVAIVKGKIELPPKEWKELKI